MPDIAELLARTTPTVVSPRLEAVERRVVRRRRRRRGAVAGAALTVVALLGVGLAARIGDDAESQRVVTGPDLRTLSEPVGAWRRAADPPFGSRIGAFTATTDDDRILVWGGRVDVGPGGGSWQGDGGIYDPATDEWEPIDEAPGDDGRHGRARLAQNRLAVVFSDDVSGPVTAAVYDLGDREWRELPPTGIDRFVDATAWDGETLALVRVSPPDDQRPQTGEPTTLRWSLGDDEWTAAAPYPLGVRIASGRAGATDQIAVWGGTTSTIRDDRPTAHEPGPDPGATADGAVYDVESDTWTEMPPGPVEPRVNPSLVWQDGQVVIAGGTRSLELPTEPVAQIVAAFDPAAATWRLLPDPPLAQLTIPPLDGAGDLGFFARASDSTAITLEPMTWQSGPQPRLFTFGDRWELAPLYDLHEFGGALLATSATIDNPDEGPFEVQVRVEPNLWLAAVEAPFANRMNPAIGTSGSSLLVVGGDEGRTLEPTSSAWVFTIDE